MLTTAGWIRLRFGPVNTEQLVLNLPVNGSEGQGVGTLVWEGAGVCLGVPATLVGTAGLLTRWQGRRGTVQPLRRPLAFPGVVFVAALGVLLWAGGVPDRAASLLSNRTFAPYYLRPSAPGNPAPPRNLVTIFLESGEDTYSDTGIFGRNLLADLDAATTGWARYDGLQQYPGGGWTMAGLVADSCAVPLRSRLLADPTDLDAYGEGVTRYLPAVRCLGDLLAAHHYDNVFLGGASGHFGGKDTFFRDHGYRTVFGLSDWQAAGDTDVSGWGLSDERLFAHARTVVDGLAAADRPFNLTLLTLDTHEPPALFPGCATGDDAPIKTAWTCSLRAVAGFIDHLRKTGILDDTVVVVTGDHLKMTGLAVPFSHELDAVPDRGLICRIWSPDPVRFGRPSADQLSMLATTLDLLGVGNGSGRAGLGVSFVGTHPLDGTALALSEEDYRSTITSPSTDLYRSFWGGPG